MLTKKVKLEILGLLNSEIELNENKEIMLDGVLTHINCIRFMHEVENYVFEEVRSVEEVKNLLENGEEVNIVDIDLWEDNYTKCEGCGKYFERDEIFYTDYDTPYCKDCVGEYATYCEYHEQYEENDDFCEVYTSHGVQIWCSNACDMHAFWCQRYEHYYSDRDFYSYEVRVGENEFALWSEEAREDHAYYCDCCDNYVDEDYFNGDYDCCDWCCGEDVSDIVGRYHSSKEKFKNLMFGICKYIRKAGGGFELEVTRDDRDENVREFLETLIDKFGDHIAFEHDSSIGEYGIEIVSAPHTKDGFYEVDWSELLKTCVEYGYKSHDGGLCGLHWHISATMFGGTNERAEENIAKLLLFYDTYFDEFVKLSRRTSSQLHWCGNYNISANCDCNFDREVLYAKNLVKNRGNGDRYKAINLTNTYARCGEYGENDNELKTVEFRINRGTLNVKTFYATIDIIFNLVRNCKKMNWTLEDFSRENVKKWFSGCKKETYEYIVKRGAFADIFYAKNNDTENTTNEE